MQFFKTALVSVKDKFLTHKMFNFASRHMLHISLCTLTKQTPFCSHRADVREAQVMHNSHGKIPHSVNNDRWAMLLILFIQFRFILLLVTNLHMQTDLSQHGRPAGIVFSLGQNNAWWLHSLTACGLKLKQK